MVHGWMMHSGPISSAELGRRIGAGADDVEAAMLRLEATGAILRGHFSRTAGSGASGVCWRESTG